MKDVGERIRIYYCAECDRYTDVFFLFDKIRGERPKSYCYKCNREFPLEGVRIMREGYVPKNDSLIRTLETQNTEKDNEEKERVKKLKSFCVWLRKSSKLWAQSEDETLSDIEDEIDMVFGTG